MGIGACLDWNRLAAVTLLLVASASPAPAANRHVIELQVRVRTMSDQSMMMQQSMDENFGAMTQSLQQTAAELTASQQKLARLRQAVQATGEATRSGSLPRQLAMLTQSTSALGASMENIEHRVQALSAEIGQPSQTVVTAGEAPPPGILFRNGMEDYEAGRYKLASQEFAEYVRFYSDTDQTPQAQFYLADSEYWAGDYRRALNDFDKMEQQYPTTEAATVELRKGLSLMKLGESEAARQEFRHLVERYPQSVEAMDARSALGKLGMEANIGYPYPRY